MSNDRKCGLCQECCKVYDINDKDLQKEKRVPCINLTEKGCNIYSNKPHTCEVFQCLWLQGLLPGEARPDRLGVIFQVVESTREDIGQLITATECRPGAFEKPSAKKLVSLLEKKIPIFREKYNGKQYCQGVAESILVQIQRKKI